MTLANTEQEGMTPMVPTEVLAVATEAAKALTGVLAKKPHKVVINNQQYLEYEDWQTVGQFYGYTAKTYEAIPVEIDGVKGAKAKADLIDFRTGIVVGGAEAYCLRDEANWGKKPWFQLASMAQTRAGSKALRNRLAWVVVLAGFKPTPAEEMTGELSGHWCREHGVNFFKTEKMRSYAHPIQDSDQWCYEHKESTKKVAKPTPIAKVKEEKDIGELWPSEDAPLQETRIDTDWLKESLEKLNWPEPTMKSYLKQVFKVENTEGSLVDVLNRLTPEQQDNFVKEIQDRLNKVA